MNSSIYNGPVLKAGWSQVSDRFYPIAALRALAADFKAGPGTFEMVTDDQHTIESFALSTIIDLERASHWTRRLYLMNHDTELWVEASTLETSRGKLLKDYLKTKNASFVLRMTGVMNRYNEVDPHKVKYLQVAATYQAADAYDRFKKRKGGK